MNRNQQDRRPNEENTDRTVMQDINPNEILRVAYQDDLAFAYRWLRTESEISPDVLNVGIDAIHKKRTRLGGFLLGEVFPSALCRHFPIPSERRTRLFAAWLSIYCFIELADRSIDAKQPLTPQSMLAASNLLAFGVAEFCSYCTNDGQRQLLLRNINGAFDGELRDHAAQMLVDRDSRITSDTNKNRALIVATIGFCLAARKCPTTYIGFVEQLLPVFQFLDDVQDVREDLEQGNITQVLQVYLSRCENERSFADDREIYLKLVHTVEFRELLRGMIDILEHALLLLDLSSDAVLVQYFSSLLVQMRSLLALCTEVTAGSRVVDPEEVVRIVIRVAAST